MKSEKLNQSIQKKTKERLTNLLGERSTSACAAQFICSTLLIGIAIQKSQQNNPALMGYLFIVIGTIARFFAGRILAVHANSRRSLLVFSGACIGQSVGWSLIACGYIYYSGLSNLMTLMALLFGTAIATGATASLSPRLRLAQLYLLIKVGSAVVMLFFIGDSDGKWLGVNIAIFLIFILKQTGSNHRAIMNAEYWRLDAQEKEGRLEALLNAVPAHISVISKDMQYLQSNRFSHQRLFTTTAIEGKDVGTVERFSDFKSMISDFAKPNTSDSGQSMHREITLKAENGAEECWLLTANATELENPPGFVVTLTDISQAKKTERDLNEARSTSLQLSKFAAIGELAAGMAHEVNNPLTIMSGNLNILSMRISSELKAENAKLFEILFTQISRIAGVVHGFLRYSRIDHSIMESIDDLHDVVKHGVQRVMPEMKHLGRRVFINSSIEKISIIGNSCALDAAMSGLLLHAGSEFETDANTFVIEIVRKSVPSPSITLRLYTTNAPLDPSMYKEIFALDERQSTAQSNWIGITTARDIFERHGGTLVLTDSPSKEYLVELTQSCQLKTVASA